MKDGELHLWRYFLNEQDYHAEKKNAILSKEESGRSSCFLNEIDQKRYICNHRFVRQVLATYLHQLPSEIEFSQTKLGKPYIKGADIFFNYSYRGNICILGISKSGEIGVDIEKMKTLQDADTFISFCFSEKEKKIIKGCGEEDFQETLFTFWTFKEAIIKSLGIGLSADLTEIDLSAFFYSQLNTLAYDHHKTYTIKKINAPDGYKSAFAISGILNTYKEYEFKDLDVKKE